MKSMTMNRLAKAMILDAIETAPYKLEGYDISLTDAQRAELQRHLEKHMNALAKKLDPSEDLQWGGILSDWSE